MTVDELEAQLRRSERRRRTILVMVGLAAATALGAFIYRSHMQRGGQRRPSIELTAEQRAQLLERINRSRAALTAADEPWRATVAAVDPAAISDGPACTRLDFLRDELALHPQSWSGYDVGELPLERGGMMSLTSTPYPISIIGPGQPLPAHSAELLHRLAALDRAQAQLAEPSSSSFEDRLADVTFDRLYATSVLLQLAAVVEPQETAALNGPARTFSGGALIARGWMYDAEASTVVCAGTVEVTSSSSVNTGSSGLNEDLLVNLVREAPHSLRARP